MLVWKLWTVYTGMFAVTAILSCVIKILGLFKSTKCGHSKMSNLKLSQPGVNIADHKPRPHTNAYVYVGGLSVLGLAIGGYLLYNKFKKPERKLIDVPPPPVVNTNIESKRDIFEML